MQWRSLEERGPDLKWNWGWNWYSILQIRKGVFLSRRRATVLKSTRELNVDLGLAEGCQGAAAGVCDLPWLLILQHHKQRVHAPQSCEMCVLWPWWVKRSLWTISIRQSSFCFTRRPRGTFRMNSVNSLLWGRGRGTMQKKSQSDQALWSGWLLPILNEDAKQKLKKIKIKSYICFEHFLQQLVEAPQNT